MSCQFSACRYFCILQIFCCFFRGNFTAKPKKLNKEYLTQQRCAHIYTDTHTHVHLLWRYMVLYILVILFGAPFSVNYHPNCLPQSPRSPSPLFLFFRLCLLRFFLALPFAFALLFILFLFALRLLRLIKFSCLLPLSLTLSLSLFRSFFVVVIEASLEYFYFIYLWFFFRFFFYFTVCVADCFARFCSLLCAVFIVIIRLNTFGTVFLFFLFVLVFFLGRCGLCIKINWLDKRENRKMRWFSAPKTF